MIEQQLLFPKKSIAFVQEPKPSFGCVREQPLRRQRHVTFSEQLITRVHERPRTAEEEKDFLFYSADEIKFFRIEYKVFKLMLRRQQLLLQHQQQQRQQLLDILSSTPYVFNLASTIMSSWLSSVANYLHVSTSNHAADDLTDTTSSSFYLKGDPSVPTISVQVPESNNVTFLIDTLYLF